MDFKSEIDVYRYIFRFYPQVPEGKFEVIARYGRIWLFVVTPECKIKKYMLNKLHWAKLNTQPIFDKFVMDVDRAFIDAGYETKFE